MTQTWDEKVTLECATCPLKAGVKALATQSLPTTGVKVGVAVLVGLAVSLGVSVGLGHAWGLETTVLKLCRGMVDVERHRRSAIHRRGSRFTAASAARRA